MMRYISLLFIFLSMINNTHLVTHAIQHLENNTNCAFFVTIHNNCSEYNSSNNNIYSNWGKCWKNCWGKCWKKYKNNNKNHKKCGGKCWKKCKDKNFNITLDIDDTPPTKVGGFFF